jgi:hypothetical protein
MTKLMLCDEIGYGDFTFSATTNDSSATGELPAAAAGLDDPAFSSRHETGFNTPFDGDVLKDAPARFCCSR